MVPVTGAAGFAGTAGVAVTLVVAVTRAVVVTLVVAVTRAVVVTPAVAVTTAGAVTVVALLAAIVGVSGLVAVTARVGVMTGAVATATAAFSGAGAGCCGSPPRQAVSVTDKTSKVSTESRPKRRFMKSSERVSHKHDASDAAPVHGRSISETAACRRNDLTGHTASSTLYFALSVRPIYATGFVVIGLCTDARQ